MLNARVENIVLRSSSEHTFATSLNTSVDAYVEAGRNASQTAKDKGETYFGNPYGKKPNAFFSAVLVRIQPFLKLCAVPGALDHYAGEDLAAVQAAIQTLVTAGDTAPSTAYVVSRCFYIQSEKLGVRTTKWIFCANGYPQLMDAYRTLQKFKVLEAHGIYIDNDHAPSSKASREVQTLIKKICNLAAKASKGGA